MQPAHVKTDFVSHPTCMHKVASTELKKRRKERWIVIRGGLLVLIKCMQALEGR
jgi:hypothetical protein